MMNKIFAVIFLLVTYCLSAGANYFTEADSAYSKGDFEQARFLYEEAVKSEGVSAGLLYNLGNTYFRLGKDGEAMVCYERALRLDPGNKVIKGNVEYLSSRVLEANKGGLKDKAGNVEPDTETFLETVYRIIAIEHSSNGWAVFAVMAFLLLLGAVAMYVFTPNVLARKTGFFSAIAFFIFTVVFIVFSCLGAKQFNSREEAVVTDYSIELLSQPTVNAPASSGTLHKGTKLRVLDIQKGADDTEWLKVRLNADNVGWLRSQSVEII